MKKKVYMCSSFNLCKSMSYLGSQICGFLKKNGYTLTSNAAHSDYIIINTCAFDDVRREQALTIINHFYKKYGGGKTMIVAGCLAKIDPKSLEDKNLILIGPKELGIFNRVFDARIKIEEITANVMAKGMNFENPYFNNSDYYILISQGCINKCSYCAIRFAKGRVTSKPPDQIINEIKNGIKEKYRRFVIISEDCGSYGADIGTDFAALLNSIAKECKGKFELSLCYIEPGRLINLFPKINKKIFKKIIFINIPVQTTSPRILKLMNRSYDIKKVLEIIQKIRSINPKIYIETHIIYSFPSEKRSDLIKTFRLTKYFNEVSYFLYNDVKGTPASRLKDKIPYEEKIFRTALIKKEGRKNKKVVFPYDSIKSVLTAIIKTEGKDKLEG